MGALDVNVQYGWEPKPSGWFFVLTASRGTPAHHSGFAVGPVSSPRTGAPAAVCEALVASAADGKAAFVDALGDVATINSGPFPGVVPADWFDGLPEGLEDLVVSDGATWANSGKMP